MVYRRNAPFSLPELYIEHITFTSHSGALPIETDYLAIETEYPNHSVVQNLICGLSQGSVIWPILFNLYINDSVYVSNKFKYVVL